MKRSSRIAATIASATISKDSTGEKSTLKDKPDTQVAAISITYRDANLNDRTPNSDKESCKVIASQENSNVALVRDFYNQDCLSLAKSLLGKVLCRRIPDTGQIVRGTIVETEAYPGGDDKASQSYLGKRTPRNGAMYMEPGTAYVYFTYGIYYCFNISSKGLCNVHGRYESYSLYQALRLLGEGSVVLIRGAEPLEGHETMQLHRTSTKKTNEKLKQFQTHELANGPSKLCIAFDITRDNCNKIDMTASSDLWIEKSKDLRFRDRAFEIVEDKRIGIDSTPPEARNKLWRFFVKDSMSESRAKVGELKKRQKLSQ